MIAEEEDFAREYARHHQALYRYCRSILRHDQDAQDALQSAMMRAFVALQTERREIDLRPWLFRIAHNESINILRRRNRAGELDEAMGDAVTLEDRVDDRETLRLLRRDLADLPERQRSALVLRELNGLGHEEIATVLGTTPAAVKQAIFEGRSALLRCREGRDAACVEIQRVLSDGDGRSLRSRPVRAHLRSCAGCREFRGALGRRPRELAALLPPLPGGAAAALLRGLFEGPAATVTAGGVATSFAAKAAIVAVIAGGGGAVALHDPGAPAARDRAPTARAARVAESPVRATTVALTAPATAPRREGRQAAPAHARTPAPKRRVGAPAKAKHHAAPAPPADAKKAAKPAPPGQATQAAKPAPAGQAEKAAKPTPPGQAKQAAKPVPPGHAKKSAGAVAPGQAKKVAKPVPPGQAKNQAGAVPAGPAKNVAKPVPPGQAKKQAAVPSPPEPAATAPAQAPPLPPGQAKKAGGDGPGKANQ